MLTTAIMSSLNEPQQKAASADTVSGIGRTVLVVDDEEVVRNIATTVLTRKGFPVLVANNGLEAIDILRARSGISLVILDLTMPVLTGEQALPLIEAIQPDLPIILSSGFNESEISRRFASAGISAFLEKPYTAQAILRKVTSVLRTATQTS